MMDKINETAENMPEFHMKQFSVLDVQEKERQRIARISMIVLFKI